MIPENKPTWKKCLISGAEDNGSLKRQYPYNGRPHLSMRKMVTKVDYVTLQPAN